MKALVALLALAGTAHAYPVFGVTDEELNNPDPTTKLGFRIGFGRMPLDETLDWSGLTLAVEHAVFGKLRMLAEYDYLWLATATDDPAMPFTSTGHRTNVGFRLAFATKDYDKLKFYGDVEVGGGLGLYDAPTGAAFVPHGFVGMHFGYAIVDRRPRASRTFEVEVNIRALVVEHGMGLGCGFGFYWGD